MILGRFGAGAPSPASLPKDFDLDFPFWYHLDFHFWYQGRIEPPKAARGHATSYKARTDGIVLSVTKNVSG